MTASWAHSLGLCSCQVLSVLWEVFCNRLSPVALTSKTHCEVLGHNAVCGLQSTSSQMADEPVGNFSRKCSPHYGMGASSHFCLVDPHRPVCTFEASVLLSKRVVLGRTILGDYHLDYSLPGIS